ncbi:MAG: PilZ domain-containing protein [Nitrospiraceae bacterium]|nr:PilZ domain-containing protein [Nitrospiraceae bacterium]MSR24170.1 PilZ domain-containing protein [Nitrospiraceae bacterium]
MEIRCPRCGKDFVRLVRREGLAEIVASAVGLYPFTCQLCAHRFLRLELGKRYIESTVDKRQYERVAATFPVTFVGEKASGAGTISRLSLGGCALESPLKLMEGMMFNLRLQPPDVNPAINVETAIVRSVRPPVVGLEFLRINPTEQFRLIQYVAGLLTAHRKVE